MEIKYLKNPEIDYDRWDHCVFSAPNSLIYGMSWYLDLVCDNWDALIVGDYEAVMPLPWKKKYGLTFIYKPWFAQQLGIFSKEPENYPVHEFIKSIPTKFLKYEFAFNYMNHVENISVKAKTNLVLSLSPTYLEIASRFTENTKRNIKKASKHIISEIEVNTFLVLLLNEVGSIYDKKNKQDLIRLIPFLVQQKHAKILGVESSNGDLLGAVCLVNFNNRIIYLHSASTYQGKNERVVYKIVEQVIKDHSQSTYLLDFEGSSHEGIARFYKGFGSVPEVYYTISKKLFGLI